MAWAEVGTSTSGRGTSGTSATVTLPSGFAAGNLLILAWSAGNGDAPVATDPSGWTPFPHSDPPNGSTHGYGFWYRIANGSETSFTLSWNQDGPDWKWSCAAFDDPAQGGAITFDTDAVNEVASATTHPAPAVTAARNHAICVRACVSADTGAVSLTHPSGYTEAEDSGGATPAHSIAYKAVNAGTEASGNFTTTITSRATAVLSAVFYKSGPIATQFGSSVTSMPVAIPSGAAGDLIWALSSVRNTGGWTAPSGWTEFGSQDSGGVGELTAFWREADGSEGATATWTATVGTTAVWIVGRTAAAEWDGASAPEINTTSSGGTPGTNPNPPSLTPSWGEAATKWLAVGGGAAETVTLSAYPSGYAAGLWSNLASGGAAAYLGVASRTAETATEDPGSYTTASSRWWYAATIAIRPPGDEEPEEHEGTAALSATGGVSAAGAKGGLSALALAGVAGTAAAGAKHVAVTLAMSSRAGLAATGAKGAASAPSLAAIAGLAIVPTEAAAGVASLSAVLGMSAPGSKAAAAAAVLAGIGAVSLAGAKAGASAAAFGVGATLAAAGTKAAGAALGVGAVPGLVIAGYKHSSSAPALQAVGAIAIEAEGTTTISGAARLSAIVGLGVSASAARAGSAALGAAPTLVLDAGKHTAGSAAFGGDAALAFVGAKAAAVPVALQALPALAAGGYKGGRSVVGLGGVTALALAGTKGAALALQFGAIARLVVVTRPFVPGAPGTLWLVESPLGSCVLSEAALGDVLLGAIRAPGDVALWEAPVGMVEFVELALGSVTFVEEGSR